jgi:hypothetical protein
MIQHKDPSHYIFGGLISFLNQALILLRHEDNKLDILIMSLMAIFCPFLALASAP